MTVKHEYTQNVVCPYCGQEDRDSWELQENDGETECGNCGETFLFVRHVEVTYSTEPRAEKEAQS